MIREGFKEEAQALSWEVCFRGWSAQMVKNRRSDREGKQDCAHVFTVERGNWACLRRALGMWIEDHMVEDVVWIVSLEKEFPCLPGTCEPLGGMPRLNPGKADPKSLCGTTSSPHSGKWRFWGTRGMSLVQAASCGRKNTGFGAHRTPVVWPWASYWFSLHFLICKEEVTIVCTSKECHED